MENQELGLWIHYNSLQLDRECISRNHYEVSLHQISLKSFQKRTDEKKKIWDNQYLFLSIQWEPV